ncbi:MAG: HAD hydrolase-like protein [Desulfobacterales bacterium]|jgi:HAD superfamily hydrolase (TIGR01450 family)
MNDVQDITIEALINRYEVLLLDAYGVLVHSSGPLVGAVELISKLNQAAKPYYILTNDASRLPTTTASQFLDMGLAIEADRIVTSGALLKDYFIQNRLAGLRCIVLGPEDSARYVRWSGGEVVPPGEKFEVLVIGDEVGFPFIETVDIVLSGLIQKLDNGDNVHLVLPNPDLIYPKSEQDFGITCGSIALILEAALHQRYPAQNNLQFDRLGKPHAAIFEEAQRRSGTRDMVMIGDQMATDIRGAYDFGIDSVLVGSGITNCAAVTADDGLLPTYTLQSIR